jgi:hypothetical protein
MSLKPVITFPAKNPFLLKLWTVEQLKFHSSSQLKKHMIGTHNKHIHTPSSISKDLIATHVFLAML